MTLISLQPEPSTTLCREGYFSLKAVARSREKGFPKPLTLTRGVPWGLCSYPIRIATEIKSRWDRYFCHPRFKGFNL